eukprot:7259260-Pyramimonas_sp.AAC.1
MILGNAELAIPALNLHGAEEAFGASKASLTLVRQPHLEVDRQPAHEDRCAGSARQFGVGITARQEETVVFSRNCANHM